MQLIWWVDQLNVGHSGVFVLYLYLYLYLYSNFANANTNIDTTQRHRSGQHRAPLLTTWAASKTKTKIWSSLVAFFISSLLILPFQVECTYVLLSSIRVNAFSFRVACVHAIIVPQSVSLIISATQWSLSITKPRDLLSCNMVKHLLTAGISAPPYLGISKPRKTPNLNRFYKRKRKTGPTW